MYLKRKDLKKFDFKKGDSEGIVNYGLSLKNIIFSVIFIEDIDGNWIEVSAELETVHGRPVKNWPQTERTLNLWGKAIMRS